MLALLLLVAMAALAAAIWVSREEPAPPAEAAKPAKPRPSESSHKPPARPPAPEPQKAAPPAPPTAAPSRLAESSPAGSNAVEPSPAEPVKAPARAGSGGRIALVIDDLGRSVADVETLATLGVPLSYAVLPFESHTPEVVAALQQRGAEILCHLPMEPDGNANPGPGALTEHMAPAEMAAATARALDAVPGAVGMNNHMGSRTSSDETAMRAILEVVGKRGLFFLDSRTSAQSVGYKVALALGMPAAERQVFLDPDRTPLAIRGQFERLLLLARQRGAAVAIGHPYPETFEVLKQEIPKARAQGFELVPVSYLMDDAGDPPP